MAHTERVAPKQPPCGASADDRGQTIFGGEGGDHLAGTRGVFIHQQHDVAVESLWPLTLCEHRHGPAANRESEEQGDQPDLPVRDAVEPRQAALALPAVSTPYKTAVLVTCKTPSPCANVANVARDHGAAVPTLDGRRIPPIWQGLLFVRVGPVDSCIMNK